MLPFKSQITNFQHLIQVVSAAKREREGREPEGGWAHAFIRRNLAGHVAGQDGPPSGEAAGGRQVHPGGLEGVLLQGAVPAGAGRSRVLAEVLEGAQGPSGVSERRAQRRQGELVSAALPENYPLHPSLLRSYLAAPKLP